MTSSLLKWKLERIIPSTLSDENESITGITYSTNTRYRYETSWDDVKTMHTITVAKYFDTTVVS